MRKRLFLFAVLNGVITEFENCLSQNHKLLDTFGCKSFKENYLLKTTLLTVEFLSETIFTK